MTLIIVMIHDCYSCYSMVSSRPPPLSFLMYFWRLHPVSGKSGRQTSLILLFSLLQGIGIQGWPQGIYQATGKDLRNLRSIHHPYRRKLAAGRYLSVDWLVTGCLPALLPALWPFLDLSVDCLASRTKAIKEPQLDVYGETLGMAYERGPTETPMAHGLFWRRLPKIGSTYNDSIAELSMKFCCTLRCSDMASWQLPKERRL